MIKNIRYLGVAALVACAVHAVSAEVLIAEGCDTKQDYAGATEGGSEILGQYPQANDDHVGFEKGTWVGLGSQPRVYLKDLALPKCFAVEGLKSRGAASVGMNHCSSTAKDHRWGYLKLAKDKLKVADGEEKTLYFRGLLTVDNKAASILSKPSSDAIGSGNSYGFLLGTSQNTQQTSFGRANSIGFYFWRTSTGKFAVSVIVNDAENKSSSKRLIDGIDTIDTGITQKNTILCYAEIKVGAGANGKEVIRAGAVPVADYQMEAVAWSDPFEQELISEKAFPTYLSIIGAYQTGAGWALMDEFLVATELSEALVVSVAGAPVLDAATLSGASGSYKVSAGVRAASATDVGVVLHDGASEGVFFSAGPVEVADGETAPFDKAFSTANLPTGKTYAAYVYAQNDASTVSNLVGTVYTGALTLEKVRDANELNRVPGEVRVSRANADPYPLTVAYVLSSGTTGAKEGQTWEAPEAVVIPAGETSAILTLKPKTDAAVREDIAVTLALASGNYAAGAADVVLELKNIKVPDGCNAWMAVADGAASNPANWSGGVPRAGDNILFDGNFSSANCVWDAETEGGPSSEVASWTQRDGYAGSVTVPTTYPEVNGSAFHVLTVAGDALLNCGTMTSPANGAEERYLLCLDVKGKFELAEAATISVQGKGYAQGKYRTGSSIGTHAATFTGDYSKIYGDVRAPVNIGSGGDAEKNAKSCGGGAFKLTVAGAARIDGTIDAQSSAQSPQGGNPERGVGAGGSIYVTAASIDGTGKVVASAYEENGASYTQQAGSGGRIALVATQGDVGISKDNLRCSGSKGKFGVGGGTIFVKNASEKNGTLLIDDDQAYKSYSYNTHWPKVGNFAAIKPGETWTFDRLLFRNRGVLTIPEGAKLKLPNGFASIASLTTSDTPGCGILYRGGEIDVPSAATHTLSGAWLFQGASSYAFPKGDVTLAEKAAIGCFELQAEDDMLENQPTCTISVDGNLTVAENSKFCGEGRGFRTTQSSPYGGHHGGVGAGGESKAFDSILNPMLPGESAGAGDGGSRNNTSGAAIVVKVAGELTMNGKASVKSVQNNWDGARAAGGTLNITAGSLAGSGTFCADGLATGHSSVLSGAGGRIAVRLTDRKATFAEDFLTRCTANGAALNNKQCGSAGTVYLQSGSEAEGAGTVVVRSTIDMDVPTPIPSLLKGGEKDVLKNAKLRLVGYGRVKLAADVKMAELAMDEKSKLDLNGKRLTVRTAILNGATLKPGTYKAADLADSGVDSSEGATGVLKVAGVGLLIVIR